MQEHNSLRGCITLQLLPQSGDFQPGFQMQLHGTVLAQALCSAWMSAALTPAGQSCLQSVIRCQCPGVGAKDVSSFLLSVVPFVVVVKLAG